MSARNNSHDLKLHTSNTINLVAIAFLPLVVGIGAFALTSWTVSDGFYWAVFVSFISLCSTLFFSGKGASALRRGSTKTVWFNLQTLFMLVAATTFIFSSFYLWKYGVQDQNELENKIDALVQSTNREFGKIDARLSTIEKRLNGATDAPHPVDTTSQQKPKGYDEN